MYIISLLIGYGFLFILSSANLSPELQCIEKINKIKGLTITKTLGSLVGIGWNDITYKETFPILASSFDHCQATPDGDFLIPDGISVRKIEEMNMQETSEAYESYSDFKTKNTFSIEAHGGLEIEGFGISGSMSYEHSVAKEHMEKHSRKGFAKKVEFHAFDLTANENAGFDKAFADRLKAVADAIKSRNLLLAQHEAEKIIADYGTHVIKKAEVGGRAVMYGFTTVESEMDKTEIQNKVSAGFDAKFKKVVNGGIKTGNQNDQTDLTGSSDSKSHLIYRGQGVISSDEGTKMKVDSLVGLKRSGATIYSLIHEGVMKNYNVTVINKVKEMIKTATMDYYRHNRIPGCTDSTKLNYFFKANVDDGTCKEAVPVKLNEESRKSLEYYGPLPRTGFDIYGYIDEYIKVFQTEQEAPVFGGIFQYCEHNSLLTPENAHLCNEYGHRNPLTGDYLCPESFKKMKELASFFTIFVNVNTKQAGCNSTDCEEKYSTEDELLIKTYMCSDPRLKIDMRSILASIGPVSTVLEAFNDRNEKGRVSPALSAASTILEMFYDKNEKATEAALVSKHLIHLPPPRVYNVRPIGTGPRYPSEHKHEPPKPGKYGLMSPIEFPHVPEIERALTIASSERLKVPKEGLIFGGIFDKQNIFSDNGRCDDGFEQYPFFHNLQICLAKPNEKNVAKSVEFGGMISCHDSNQECPKGFSKYLATIIKGCAYHYCATVATSYGFTKPPSPKQPPYNDRHLAISNIRYDHEEPQLTREGYQY